MDSSSRHFILALLLAGLTLSCRAAGGSFATTIAVDTAHPIAPANPLVLGNNIQWVDRGDEMLSGDGKNLSGPMIEKAREMALSLFERDPYLSQPEHALLAEAFERFWKGTSSDVS